LGYIIVSPVVIKEDAQVLVNAKTLNDLVNRVNQLERAVMSG